MTTATHHAHTGHTQTPTTPLQALTAAKTEVRRLEALKVSLPHAIHDAAAQGDTVTLREARAQQGDVDAFLEAARVTVARAQVAALQADHADTLATLETVTAAFVIADAEVLAAKRAFEGAQKAFFSCQGHVQMNAMRRETRAREIAEAEGRVAQMTAALPGGKG